MRWIERHWYRRSWLSVALLPLALCYCIAVFLRRGLYRLHLLRARSVGVPVVIVGNITVGGTGKTPLVIALAQMMTRAGLRPGIVTRGYGGSAARWPLPVSADSPPSEAGDEAVALARHGGCPVIADPDRARGARCLVRDQGCDVIVSDDGLQHYALARDVEIAVIDAARRQGNGFCLPAGPLREPASRLRSVDLVVTNGQPGPGEYGMRLRPVEFRPLQPDDGMRPLDAFRGQRVHAVAGIGHPARFFATLRALGIDPVEHPFPDHHDFQRVDLAFGDALPLIMTEKDAVKCARLGGMRGWYLVVQAEVEDAAMAAVMKRLRKRQTVSGVEHG